MVTNTSFARAGTGSAHVNDFNQSLDNVRLPACLESITFGDSFNQSIQNVRMPLELRSITFENNYNQSLDSVWPPVIRLITEEFCDLSSSW